jgi:hypothetical protein
MGAWANIYKQGLKAEPNTPLGLGIIAIKRELSYCACDSGMILSSSLFGAKSAASARWFQQTHPPLVADGEIGPRTALVLFRRRARLSEETFGIPDHWLTKVKTLESNNDPAAIGSTDPDDHGLMQYNLRYHPNLTLAAVTSGTILRRAGQDLGGFMSSLNDWEAAVVAWNVGLSHARDWLEAGKPTSGQPVGGIDWAVRATNYLRLVRQAAA